MIQQEIKKSFASELKCSVCGAIYPLQTVQTFATCCQQPLVVSYHFDKPFSKEILRNRPPDMYRYFEMLPVQNEENIISLGEGMTPLLPLKKLGDQDGFPNLFIKNESLNPTGSFKARGLSMAVSRAKELGIERCIIPTAGNAGGALAAYCAKAGLECVVVMPRHTPQLFKTECALYGAEVILVDGLINDCAQRAGEIQKKDGSFDVSTLKEPYRLEGKKTMGYEIAEQMNWLLPDVIIYPAGGGTGLIGIWKAFEEMEKLGWIKKPFPKMIAVQAANCAPLLAAAADEANWKQTFKPQPSIANGLVVPYPFGLKMMQRVIKESGGVVLTISEQEMSEGIKEVAKKEGIFLSPEGSATYKALHHLIQKNIIKKEDKIVLLNTGSGYKYLENLAL
ncbi:MAG: threonine synthase [Chitinophagaceae bacterium]